jgi:thymidylate synthase (FAD)
MKVRLVSYSQPAEEFRKEGINDAQDLIAFCAKVSNPSGQFNMMNSRRLLNYLIDNKHWSPFEMASACVEISTTRDIARQVLRHRSFHFQEYSQRYSDPTKDLSFVTRDARLQHPTNRQDSLETEDEILMKQWITKQEQIIHEAGLAYRWAVENGIAKEQARVVLPEGNTVSKLYMNGTFRSWIHYIELRAGNGTQKEHMALAREVQKVISSVLPMADQILS